MKIKVPQKIKIGLCELAVKCNQHLRDDEGYAGITNFRTSEIQVLPQLVPRRKDATLLHELIHVFEDMYHFRLSEDDNWRIAEGMLEFMVNNLGIEFDWSEIKELST